MELKIMDRVLAANDVWVGEVRDFLQERQTRMLNVIGSPGAGKTALLEKTIELLRPHARIGVIEGDIATARDALRIQQKGVPAYQINTGSACHLEANLVYAALKELCRDNSFDYIFVENIGNLVCPAEFDIGEDSKIAVLSVTEGDDKIEKYPLLFSQAKLLVISKIGLLAHTNFSMEAARGAFAKLNPQGLVCEVDSLSGKGFETWIRFLLS